MTLLLALASLTLVPLASGQLYDPSQRPDGAYEYIQPENTTILGNYGHSPAVYPSRR